MKRERPPQLGPGVPTLALDALDHLIDAHPLQPIRGDRKEAMAYSGVSFVSLRQWDGPSGT